MILFHIKIYTFVFAVKTGALMDTNFLDAITPVDGRYAEKVKDLSPYFSEASLFKYRLLVEVEYFIALCSIPLPQLADFNREYFEKLRELYINFQLSSAKRMKEIEKTTNHDVKAVEYYLKEKFDELGISDYKEFIHFGLTSQDINNTAVPKLFFDSLHEIYIPLLEDLILKMKTLAQDWKSIPMLARTHGQPASPTTVGKEFLVFVTGLRIN